MPVFLCKVNGFPSMAFTCHLCSVLAPPFLLTWIPIGPSLFLGVQYAPRMSVMEASYMVLIIRKMLSTAFSQVPHVKGDHIPLEVILASLINPVVFCGSLEQCSVKLRCGMDVRVSLL